MDKGKKKILVAPLEWGLGHAARCVPVIHELLRQEADVIIAADRGPLAFLKKEFPALEFIRLPGYNISYPGKNENMAVTMALQIPNILAKIREENRTLRNIIKEKKINGVISDQRFGLYTSQVPCVYITHQVMIKSPFFENILYTIHKNFIDKYTQCWIPDYASGENLSGDLSHRFPLPANGKYIGPISRFDSPALNQNTVNANYKYMAILSGPEPQRTLLEKKILSELKKEGSPALIARGNAEGNALYTDNNVEIHDHFGTGDMLKKILASEVIISRSGYSSIMDLALLKKKAILIPTPGQTEQEYLAEYHYREQNNKPVSQSEFLLSEAPVLDFGSPSKKFAPPGSKLALVISEFTKSC